MNVAPREEILPLTPQAAAVLLSLASGAKHGYAIAEWCRGDSGDGLTMSTGSIYPLINRLKNQGLVKDAGSGEATSSPYKRKLYELTPYGREVLGWEADRQSDFVSLARRRLRQYDERV